MKVRLINLWDLFRSSFWFVPALMVIGAGLLAHTMCRLDESLTSAGVQVPWMTTTAQAARSTLSSIAGATIALAGVVFSITVLTLSIASSQYGSRIIRNVMAGSIADLVIGQYVGTSLYCLLVLRMVRDPDVISTAFVPHYATAVGLILGVISLVMLIWFVHHVATAIQAPKLVEGVACDLNDAVERLFPDRIGEQVETEQDSVDESEKLRAELGVEAFAIRSDAEGYVEGIDGDGLVAVARHYDAVLTLDCKPGDFVTLDQPVARLWWNDNSMTAGEAEECEQAASDAVNRVVLLGARRTPRQDVGFAAWELVEIAVRALSPGINDPFTAMNCIDRLGAALGRLAEREQPTRVRLDESGELRVLVTEADGFPEVLNDSFNQIRQYGVDSVAVSIRMLEALTKIAQHATRNGDLEAIARQAEALRDAYAVQHSVDADLADFDRRYQRLVACIEREEREEQEEQEVEEESRLPVCG